MMVSCSLPYHWHVVFMCFYTIGPSSERHQDLICDTLHYDCTKHTSSFNRTKDANNKLDFKKELRHCSQGFFWAVLMIVKGFITFIFT